MLSVKYVFHIWQETNGWIVILKTVLKSEIRKMWVQSKIWRQWLKIGVLQGSKTTSAFCKLRLPNFARDKSSNHDSENCSEISAVTRFRICLEQLHFPTFMFFTPPYCTWKGGWHCRGCSTCCPRYGLLWFYGSPGNESLPKLIYALYCLKSQAFQMSCQGAQT